MGSLPYLLLCLSLVSTEDVSRYQTADTLQVGEEAQPVARTCLAGLSWKPTTFTVTSAPADSAHGDATVRFPSPLPSGDETNDVVVLEWYQVRDEEGQPVRAPAMVVVHESGSSMAAGRFIARYVRSHGVHAFMLQLPYYGQRRGNAPRPNGEQIVAALRQGIADTRRAYDAVAVLPLVDRERIGLQGTSLGGFVTATTAGMDNCFDQVFITLAGGDLLTVIQKGQRDAAKFRENMQAAGIDEAKLKEIAGTIEPLSLAHRLVPDKTWMFTAKYDTVVPKSCSRSLCEAAKLPEDHYIELLADHYSGAIYVPLITKQMCNILNGGKLEEPLFAPESK